MPGDAVEDLKYQRSKVIEATKLLFDFYKHLTTISSAIILVLATYLEKVFKDQQHWSFLIGVVFIGLMVSIVSSLFFMLTFALLLSDEKIPNKNEIKYLVYFSLGGFLTSMLALSVFALVNFYH